MKPLFKTIARGSAILAYTSLETGEKRFWDPYRMTERDLSRLSPAMFCVVRGRIKKNIERYGRRIGSLLIACFEAGIACGFTPVCIKELSSISWTVKVEHQNQPAEYARFLALSWKWKKSKEQHWSKTRYLLNSLLASSAPLRFVVDTSSNRAVTIHPQPKRIILGNPFSLDHEKPEE